MGGEGPRPSARHARNSSGRDQSCSRGREVEVEERVGAKGGTRTPTTFRPQASETCASTSSATFAGGVILGRDEQTCQCSGFREPRNPARRARSSRGSTPAGAGRAERRRASCASRSGRTPRSWRRPSRGSRARGSAVEMEGRWFAPGGIGLGGRRRRAAGGGGRADPPGAARAQEPIFYVRKRNLKRALDGDRVVVRQLGKERPRERPAGRGDRGQDPGPRASRRWSARWRRTTAGCAGSTPSIPSSRSSCRWRGPRGCRTASTCWWRSTASAAPTRGGCSRCWGTSRSRGWTCWWCCAITASRTSSCRRCWTAAAAFPRRSARRRTGRGARTCGGG